MNLDGKIANQSPRTKWFIGEKSICNHCGKTFIPPKHSLVKFRDQNFVMFDYIDTPHYIFYSKSGYAATYCNLYCAKKHNHRFNRKNK